MYHSHSFSWLVRLSFRCSTCDSLLAVAIRFFFFFYITSLGPSSTNYDFIYSPVKCYSTLTDSSLEGRYLRHRSPTSRSNNSNVSILFFSSFWMMLQLTSLGLSWNRVGGRASLALSRMLSLNSTLRKLDLSGNPLTETGGRSIVRRVCVRSFTHRQHRDSTTLPYVYVQHVGHHLFLCKFRPPGTHYLQYAAKTGYHLLSSFQHLGYRPFSAACRAWG